ncbi:cytochrome b561 [Loktanella fryxellensis]|uniref:Cytochrome b561 n=1 Tax=Loktanella fryxellensis TaxID=245187 RepID=A0A1H8ADP7_9RHOB|nr:cytochrome b/b6 domain-containing protein [Loktanella fryxellensis]SEM67958.1 cytochrome b561 [Loktanella fryxellensis]
MVASSRYSRLQIGLHWLIAVLILATWWLGDGMGRALRDRAEAGETGITGDTWHVWLGGAVLLLVIVRLILRLRTGVPDPLAGTPAPLQLAGTWGHRALYLLMIVAPTMGALAWYAGLRQLGDPHVLVANTLMILALGYAVMGLYHHYIRKDGTLTRMTRGT